MSRRYVHRRVGMLRTVGKYRHQCAANPTATTRFRTPSPIGVFDSGVGGLTVLRALLDRAARRRLRLSRRHRAAALRHQESRFDPAVFAAGGAPAARARREVPRRRVQHRVGHRARCAHAANSTPVPVIGVLEPGAAAACRATRAGRIAVLATESTVRGGAYQAAIARRRPDAIVTARACPLFVALAEEGWTDGPIVEGVIHRYLDDVFVAGAAAAHPDTLVLGCTHFPVLAPALRKVLGTRRRDRRFGGDDGGRAGRRPRRSAACCVRPGRGHRHAARDRWPRALCARRGRVPRPAAGAGGRRDRRPRLRAGAVRRLTRRPACAGGRPPTRASTAPGSRR